MSIALFRYECAMQRETRKLLRAWCEASILSACVRRERSCEYRCEDRTSENDLSHAHSHHLPSNLTDGCGRAKLPRDQKSCARTQARHFPSL